ncbi:MAG: VOC family protein [Phycisphaeraceae bacterium]|nr:VOC family protein [Phycisphaerales bacterium]MCB9861292.1 VOC family protein [Phycisphaeraceae bacterium]
MAAPVVHFEIGCKDLEKTRDFYSKLLGWEYAEGMPSMAMVNNLGPYAEKKTDGIGGHIQSLGHEPHQYVTFYALVDDIEATLAKCESLGGSTLIPKQEVPGMGWFAWFRDPEGNCIGLWKAMQQG